MTKSIHVTTDKAADWFVIINKNVPGHDYRDITSKWKFIHCIICRKKIENEITSFSNVLNIANFVKRRLFNRRTLCMLFLTPYK